MTISPTRRGLTLGAAAREFVRHPSPWLIGATLVAAVIARIMHGDWEIGDALVPVAMLAVFPFLEWTIHVSILHWRPRRIAGVTVDPLLARKHREHHVEPRDVPLVFIPWQSLLWVLPLAVAIGVVVFPATGAGLGRGLTFLAWLAVLGLGYEWCHYLVHTDYKPKTALYRSIWRNHRQHHFKNEHYWFTVTSSGTADRVLGTYPDPATVATSPTAKNLHGAAEHGSVRPG
jgi:hypothetical protein